MKTAFDICAEQGMPNTIGNIDFIRKIQFDAVNHGMNLAAAVCEKRANQNLGGSRSCAYDILTAADNLKESDL